jgi:hypothetical protein
MYITFVYSSVSERRLTLKSVCITVIVLGGLSAESLCKYKQLKRRYQTRAAVPVTSTVASINRNFWKELNHLLSLHNYFICSN